MNPGMILAGRYRIDAHLGAGSGGEVYKVFDTILSQPAAIKIFTSLGAGADAAALQRFEREGKALSQMAHPGIVKVFRCGFLENNTPFVSMELLDGKTLRDYLNEKKTLPCDEAINLAIKICKAMEHAHSFQIIHRDLKPENIVLVQSENGIDVKIIDFGLSKVVNEGSTLSSSTKALSGTASYMSPEQCTGNAVDRHSDIYSFGCILFEMLLGKPPFIANSPAEVMLMQLNAPARSLSKLAPTSGFPKKLDELVSRCLSKDKSSRYDSFSELAIELKSISALDCKAQFKTPVLASKKPPVKILASLLAAITGTTIFYILSRDDWMLELLVSSSPKEAIKFLSTRIDHDLEAGELKQAAELEAVCLNSKAYASWTARSKNELDFALFEIYVRHEDLDKAIESGLKVLRFDLRRISELNRSCSFDELPKYDAGKSAAVCKYLLKNEGRISHEQWGKLSKLFRMHPDYLLFAYAPALDITYLIAKTQEHFSLRGEISPVTYQVRVYLNLIRCALLIENDRIDFARYGLEKLLILYKHNPAIANRIFSAYCAFCFYELRENHPEEATKDLDLAESIIEPGELSNEELRDLENAKRGLAESKRKDRVKQKRSGEKID